MVVVVVVVVVVVMVVVVVTEMVVVVVVVTKRQDNTVCGQHVINEQNENASPHAPEHIAASQARRRR